MELWGRFGADKAQLLLDIQAESYRTIKVRFRHGRLTGE
jgi:hypothetical protein